MNFQERLIESMAVLAALILCAALLKRLKILSAEHSDLFAKLVTNFTLPALIFATLSQHRLTLDQVYMAAAMMLAEVACMFLAIVASNLLRLSHTQKGALVLTATFGSSAFLGYAVIREVFTSPQALGDAIVISELGVGSLIFTLGIFLAIHYGEPSKARNRQRDIIRGFLLSPVFLSVIAGLLFPFLRLDPTKGIALPVLYKTLGTVGSANTVLVALTVGTMLHLPKLRWVIGPVIAVCIIKLIAQPVLAALPANLFSFPETWKQILVLEAAMPSATLAAVFAKRYGCDGELASVLVVVTLALSMVSIVAVVALLG